MSETIQEIRERYKTKYLIARSAADERQREADERIPGMRQVHERMDAVGLALLKAAFAPGKDGTILGINRGCVLFVCSCENSRCSGVVVRQFAVFFFCRYVFRRVCHRYGAFI